MKHKNTLRTLLIASTSIAIFKSAADAAVVPWNGAAGDLSWGNTGNWSGGALPADIAGFGAAVTAPSAITDDGSTRTLNQLSFLGLPAGNTLSIAGNVLTLNGSGANKVIVASDATTLSPVTIDSAIVLGGNVRINAGGSKITLNGVISEPEGTGRGLVKGNGATLELNGANTFTGAVTVLNGHLSIGHASALGTATSPVLVGQAGTDNKVELGTQHGVSFARDVEVVNKGAAATKATVIGGVGNPSGAASSTWTGTVYLNQSVNLSAKTGGNVSNAASFTFAGNLVDGASLAAGGVVQKVETGTVRLSGSANTYSLATSVNTGTLLVNGALSALDSSVTVKSGARLGGNGTIGRPVNVETGGILGPGDGIGVLTIGSDRALNFQTGAILEWDLGAASSDVVAAPLVTFGADLTLKLRNPGGIAVDPTASHSVLSWTGADPAALPNLLIDPTSVLSGTFAWVGEADGLPGGELIIAGVSEQVPEPSMAWVGVAALGLLRRRPRTRHPRQ